ncbi:MAG: DUF6335 family protein [Elainellaceae cyanobacterium]
MDKRSSDAGQNTDKTIGQSTQPQTNVSVGEHTAGTDPQGTSADQTPISDITPPGSQSEAYIAAGKPTTGGDTFTDQGQAKVVGEEAVGGTTPTPGQNVVGEIGEAVGVSYAAQEPVAGVEKMQDRDDERWELDPESSEDYKGHKP